MPKNQPSLRRTRVTTAIESICFFRSTVRVGPAGATRRSGLGVSACASDGRMTPPPPTATVSRTATPASRTDPSGVVGGWCAMLMPRGDAAPPSDPAAGDRRSPPPRADDAVAVAAPPRLGVAAAPASSRAYASSIVCAPSSRATGTGPPMAFSAERRRRRRLNTAKTTAPMLSTREGAKTTANSAPGSEIQQNSRPAPFAAGVLMACRVAVSATGSPSDKPCAHARKRGGMLCRVSLIHRLTTVASAYVRAAVADTV
mmetsp:Transcript_9068/g.32032  ORF Transcript_9068/g.32032 Transcript_9068/m.32032 type:complete len:258 (+) Transcript_9068:521-1294(+)